MFAADSDTLAKAHRIGFHHSVKRLLAFSLVHGQNDRCGRTPQPAGDFFIQRRYTGAAIDDEQGNIGSLDCRLRLLPHPARQSGNIIIFIPCGINDVKGQVV